MVKMWIRKKLLAPAISLLASGALLVAPRTVVRDQIKNVMRRFCIRGMDVICASLGFLLSLPFLIVVPILIKLDSPGPVFYKQVRTGVNRRKKERRVTNLGSGQNRRQLDQRRQTFYGKPFYIYKFRTMVDGAERRSGPVWAMQDDPRITNLGRLLRKFHIDEIPQFWNVLRGEMSLVGPRPERPEIIKKIITEIPEYRERLNVKPGVTGLAQVCAGYDGSIEDVRRKIHFDMLYINNQSLHLYLRVLGLTLIRILSTAPTIDLGLASRNLVLKPMSRGRLP
jgi:lipopolysaccharide/colanic/teichoic acid biosynthesis glycosyltransferase